MKLKIEKLVFGGQGLGRLDGKVYFVWNALPGEEVEIEIIKQNKKFVEAQAVKIVERSPYRKEPKEDHFMSCSAWQILDFSQENAWKRFIAQEVYEKLGGLSLQTPPDIAYEEKESEHYRNKMEYHFVQENDEIKLAFYERGGLKLKSMNEGCLLARKEINVAAKEILIWLNEIKAPISALKNLLLRFDGEKTLAGLIVRQNIKFASMPKISKNLAGFHIYFADPYKPSNWLPEKIKVIGEDFLTSKINGRNLDYGLLSFFQINENMFKKALEDISQFVDEGSEIVDYYSGVGTIGLGINKKIKKGVLVESNPEAVKFAKENIEKNKISNFEAVCAPAEKTFDYITRDKIVILDPVRAGLHTNIVKKILKERPKKVIYLSCDISTQARDLKYFSALYSVKFLKLYNFFPKTPHIEALAVLELNKAK
ncbi:MAG TPA: 23S rRNA (uracil(1939)-C(5))-methyltransferase RlmD [Candidatus Magasanikbacteria bacterium]|nr:23S rRNA (uracil(1939)-C(5))-methyltransferase RlmD [Candidatus Magasanikbacteria bacterium]